MFYFDNLRIATHNLFHYECQILKCPMLLCQCFAMLEETPTSTCTGSRTNLHDLMIEVPLTLHVDDAYHAESRASGSYSGPPGV